METEPIIKSPQMQMIEHRYGKPIESVLADLYEELGSHEAVAERLGIHRVSLIEWRRRLRLKLKRSLRYSISQ